MTEKRDGELTFKDLLDAGLHFGHQTKRWNPKMKRYIFGKRNGIYIIDLAKTLDLFEEARGFIADTIMRGRKVLLVGTKKQAREIVQKTAEESNQPYVVNRWLGGMMTNAKTVRKSIDKMVELEMMQAEGAETSRSKREMSRLGRKLEKLQNNLNGVRDMNALPGALVVVDVTRESNAIKEARCLNIPVVAIVDTNCDPDPIDYPVPGNDDSIRSIELIITEIGATIKEADANYERVAAIKKAEREKAEAEEKAAAEAASQARKKQDAARKAAIKKAMKDQPKSGKETADKSATKTDAKPVESKPKAEVKPEEPKAEKKPATAKPVAAKPATAKPAAAKPAVAKPATAKPAAAKPAAAKPAAAKPAAVKPAAAKPATAKPATAKPVKKADVE